MSVVEEQRLEEIRRTMILCTSALLDALAVVNPFARACIEKIKESLPAP
jgi:hypothetical protein